MEKAERKKYGMIREVLYFMGLLTLIGSLFGCKNTKETEKDPKETGNTVQTVSATPSGNTDTGAVTPTAGEETAAAAELKEFSYSPGYSDMNGAYHNDKLKKNENGEWIIESRNRDSFEEPEKVTTYAVSDEDAASFIAFLKDKEFSSLSERPESGDFWLDHSPWHYYMLYDCSAIGGKKRQVYSFDQYREYTDEDRELMNEADERFAKLRGEVISEVIDTSE